MPEKLRIGRIPYANLFPIFHVLQRECDCRSYEFVDGYPSALNRMLREGTLDISPSSSVEYLRHEEKYLLLNGHSISSKGPVGSILVFSREPLESLEGGEVFVTHQSDTSVALLQVILRKFLSIDCTLTKTTGSADEAIRTHPAYMVIGDEALLAARQASPVENARGESACRLAVIDGQPLHVCDLGALWYEKTGLPFTFALWIAVKDAPPEKKALIERFGKDLDRSRDVAQTRLAEIAKECPGVLPPDEMLAYWRGIIYDLGDGCRKGLNLFRDYLTELNLF